MIIEFRLLFVLVLVGIITVAIHAQVNPTVKEILETVSIDSLIRTVDELSGARDVVIQEKPTTIKSRYKGYPGNESAANYIEEKLTSYGLTIENHKYSSSGRNVLGIQKGTKYPDITFVFCGHYDSGLKGATSPGADDNASSTATVLEAARLIHRYTSKYTILYALWDEEEQWMVGSKAYADRAKNNNENLKGIINMDMLAWDKNNDFYGHINTCDVGEANLLKDKVLEVNTTYKIGMQFRIKNPPEPSDHIPFQKNGFSAIGVEEDWTSDKNPNYHKASDKTSTFNKTYYHAFSRLMISVIASLAEIENGTFIIDTYSAATTNQFLKLAIYGSTITYSVVENGPVNVCIFDVKGKKVQTVISQTMQPGSYTTQLNTNLLAQQMYFLRVKNSNKVTHCMFRKY